MFDGGLGGVQGSGPLMTTCLRRAGGVSVIRVGSVGGFSPPCLRVRFFLLFFLFLSFLHLTLSLLSLSPLSSLVYMRPVGLCPSELIWPSFVHLAFPVCKKLLNGTTPHGDRHLPHSHPYTHTHTDIHTNPPPPPPPFLSFLTRARSRRAAPRGPPLI